MHVIRLVIMYMVTLFSLLSLLHFSKQFHSLQTPVLSSVGFTWNSEINLVQTSLYASDTIKAKDSTNASIKYYIIAGSYLIPKNADSQVSKLKKLGFENCHKYNFPESEYYSVVVDTFNANHPNNSQVMKLKKFKIDYFIKHF